MNANYTKKFKRPFKVVFWLFCLCPFISTYAEDLKLKVKKLENRIEELEFASYLRKNFYIGGSLDNHYENYTSVVEADTKISQTINAYITKFKLDLNFDVSNNFKIYTRSGMSKFWNHQSVGRVSTDPNDVTHSRARTPWAASQQGSYGLSGSEIYLDRAYAAYTFDFNLTFAIGRMPTSNGAPSHQMDAKERQGTYPRFGYNSIFDGVALAYSFKDFLPKEHKLDIRALYTPYQNVNYGDRTKKRQDTYYGETYIAESNTPMYTLQLDYMTESIPFMKNFNFTFFYYYYPDFYEFDVDADYAALYTSSAYFFYVGLEGIANTGLNLSYSLLKAKSYANESNQGYNTIYDSKGHLINLNYQFQNKMVFGVDYIVTDKDFYMDNFTYITLVDFHGNANALGSHVFFSLPLWKNTRLRSGYYKLKLRPTAFTELENQTRVDSLYTQLQMDF